MSELRGSVDELEGDLLEGSARGLRDEALSQGEDPLLDSDGGALDHEEVFVDDAVVGETAHGVDGLLSEIDGRRTAVLVVAATDSVDLLVDLSPVMEPVLTSAGNRPLDSTRMPGSDTSNLSKTLVSLSRKTSRTPTSGDALETLTLRDTDDVDHLVLLEDGRDGDRLLEQTNSEGDFLGDGSSIDLDFHEMGLLLPQLQFADLGVDQQADDCALATDAIEFLVDGVPLLLGSVVLGVFAESQLLGRVPVLVKSSSDFFTQMLGPDGGQGAKTLGGFDVTNNTDGDHGRGFQNGHGFHDLFLVEL